MITKKKAKRTIKGIILILAASLLASCAGGAGQTAVSWPEVSVDLENETAYFSAGSFLYAVNLTSGAEKWHFPAEADSKISFFAAPALSPDGQLILGGYDNKLYSLDPLSGKENWSFTEATSRYVTSPLVDESGIYAPNSDNFLYALDLSGNKRWAYETTDTQWGTPVTDGSKLFLPSMNHHMHALVIETGKLIWQSEDLGGSTPGMPALGADGSLYFGTIASEVLALDGDGKVTWRVPTGDWVWGGPVLDGDRLYFGDLNGSVFVVDAKNGTVIWNIQPETKNDPAIAGKPLVMGEVLYFGSSSGILYAVNKSDGSPRWNKPLEGKIHFGPVAAGEHILVTMTASNRRDHLLIAFDQNGNQVWSFSTKK